jgi:hypothetical protein
MSLNAKTMSVEIVDALLSGRKIGADEKRQMAESWEKICAGIIEHFRKNVEITQIIPADEDNPAVNGSHTSYDEAGSSSSQPVIAIKMSLS